MREHTLTRTDCLVCGSAAATPMLALQRLEERYEITEPNQIPPTEGTWQVVECSNCGFWHVNPRPTAQELERYYQTYYDQYPTKSPDYRSAHGKVELNRWLAKKIASLRPGARVLDVGCGFGFLLAELRERGCQVKGIDISEEAVAYATGVLSVDAVVGDCTQLSGLGDPFDVVTAVYVLEHVLEPFALVKQISQVLKPGGLAFFIVPNVSFFRLLYQINFLRRLLLQNRVLRLTTMEVPAHLNFFSPVTLSMLLGRAEFKTSPPVSPQILGLGRWYSTRLLLKRLARYASESVRLLSFNKIFIGYAMMLVGEKAFVPEG